MGAYHGHNECVGQDQTQNACVWHRAKRTGVSAATHGVHAFTDPGPPSYLKRWPRSRLKGNLPILFSINQIFNQDHAISHSQSIRNSNTQAFLGAPILSHFPCLFADLRPRVLVSQRVISACRRRSQKEGGRVSRKRVRSRRCRASSLAPPPSAVALSPAPCLWHLSRLSA